MVVVMQELDLARACEVLTEALRAYVRATPGTLLSIDRLDPQLAAQAAVEIPDLLLHVVGPSRDSETPLQFVAEVAAMPLGRATEATLRHYAHLGVGEFLHLGGGPAGAEWFVLRHHRDGRRELPADGVLHSEEFPGLWIDVPALLRADGVALQAAVHAGVATADHAAFCRRLH
ncbi:MAG: hypothetical protein FJ265_00815 [Planctomycetes bacterium]|nr:hypothetical protein [Planctomycetota bacterium]